MKDDRERKGRLGTLILGVSLMGILYGWFVYAGEIENDVGSVANMVTAANKTTPVDPSGLATLISLDNTAESIINNGISKDLYGPTDMSPADAMITTHFSSYCASSYESGNCPSDLLLQYGDVKASSVLRGTVYDSVRAKAAQDYFTNFISPPGATAVSNFSANESSGPISAATVTNDTNLKSSYTQALSDEALLSVVREVFAEANAKRTPSSNGGTSGPSWMQLMESQVLQRAMNSAWASSLSSLTEQQVNVEQAKIQAQQLAMAYENYRQGERIELLLAAMFMQNYRGNKAAQSQLASQPSQQTLDNAAQQGQQGGTTPPSPPSP